MPRALTVSPRTGEGVGSLAAMVGSDKRSPQSKVDFGSSLFSLKQECWSCHSAVPATSALSGMQVCCGGQLRASLGGIVSRGLLENHWLSTLFVVIGLDKSERRRHPTRKFIR